MELIAILVLAFFLWLLIGPFVLWGRTSDLYGKYQSVSTELVRLQAEVRKLRRELADHAAVRETAAAEATAVAVEAKAAAPADAPATPGETAAVPAPPTRIPPPTPAAPAPLPHPAAPLPQRRRPIDAERAAAAARVAMDERASAVTRRLTDVRQAPAGPGVVALALRRLGLAPADTGEPWSKAALEAWLEGRMLAVVGGIALLLGAVFFLSLAFSRGWITEPMRVLVGLAAGAALLVLGELAFARVRGIVAHVLVAVGLAIVALSLFAATRLYGLIPVELGLAAAFLAAAASAVIAVRHDSELVAAFGLISVLASPPVLGASPTLVTLLFVAVTLIGTTGVALFRAWVWLPPLAFVLSAPQLASYVMGEPPVVEGLAAVAGFWLVNTIASGGEETRHATDRLRPATVTLLLATGAFTVWAGFALLRGDSEVWRGTFLAALAVAHLGLGLFFLLRNGDRHPFGLVVAASGVAALTMAVPIEFGGPPVPIAWAAEAVALAWVAVVRRHPYSAGVSVLLAVMAIGHLVAVEYPPDAIADGFVRSIPFVGPEGLTFGFTVAALVIAVLIAPLGWLRAALVIVGALLSIYVLPFELSGPALVAGWTAIAAAGVVGWWLVVAPRLPATFREDRVAQLDLPPLVAAPIAEIVGGVSIIVRPLFVITALVAGVAALAHLAAVDYPAGSVASGLPHDVPFVGLPGLSLAILLAGMLTTGVLVALAWARVGLIALAAVVVAYAAPFELSGPPLVWAWATIATAALGVEARVIVPRAAWLFGGSGGTGGPSIVRFAGALVGVAAIGHLLVFDFPIDRIRGPLLSSVPYGGAEGLSLAAVLLGLTVVSWAMTARWVRLGAAAVGAALLVHTAPFEIAVPHVTVAWAVLGIAALALVRRLSPVEPLAPLLRRITPEGVGERLPYLSAGLALVYLVVQSLWLAQPGGFVSHLAGDAPASGSPFVDERTYVLVVLAAFLGAAGWTWTGITPLARAGVAAAIPLAWLLPFEVRPGYAVAGWSALALAGAWAARRAPSERALLAGTSLTLAALGGVVALVVVAPPDRLLVDASTRVLGWPILTDATVALGALALALGAAALLHREDRMSRFGFMAAGVIVVYLLSVGAVDVFQRAVGTRPLDDLQKEAQVALSVLWSVLGGVAFAAGLALHRPPIRLSGLALLGLATVKVFLVDLAALDVAYRVLSLVALGVLLLVSALIYSRMQHPHGPVAPTHA